MNPKISVLMPVRNAARFLEEALDSVIDQTLDDWELVMVDDDSSDTSTDIMHAHARNDPRIHLVCPGRVGVTAALNIGLRMCRADYVARMDADDVCMRNRFAEQIAFLEQHSEVVAVGCAVLQIDEDGDAIGINRWQTDHDVINELLLRGQGGIAHPTAMIRRSALQQIGGYREAFQVAQDKDLWLRLCEVGRLSNMPEVLLKYREHSSCVGATRSTEQQAAVRRAICDARERRGLEGLPSLPHARSEDPMAQRRNWIRQALRHGHHATARKHLLWLTRHAPLSPRTWLLAGRTRVHAAWRGGILRRA